MIFRMKNKDRLTILAAVAWLALPLAMYGYDVFQGIMRVPYGQGEPYDAKAQFNLGVMYDKGEGAPRDHAEAMKWYRKAADQGNAEAQLALEIANKARRD
jgi:TPR repeat protein